MKIMSLVVAVVLSCGFHNDPIPNTPVPGAPCGNLWRSCGNHLCCANVEVCGGTAFSGCPAGECCYTGEDGKMRARGRQTLGVPQ
jgi:hypothetical protein